MNKHNELEVNRKENRTISKMNNPDIIRLKVFSENVRIDKKPTGIYTKLMNRGIFDANRRFLYIRTECIGFMVSPEKLHMERHKALTLPEHTVVELKQYFSVNNESLAVIQNKYIKYAILWKRFFVIDRFD